MADPRAFISFDFDHNQTDKNLFVGQIKNSRTPFSAQDWSSKEPLPQSTWEKELEEKVGKCHLMIVLVGKSMGTQRESGRSSVSPKLKMFQPWRLCR